MSDPVTNVEIEDVLSSIRKLVSDGDKGRTRDPAPQAEEAASAESKPDKLVLSPAFLVQVDPDDAAPANDRQAANDRPADDRPVDDSADYDAPAEDAPTEGSEEALLLVQPAAAEPEVPEAPVDPHAAEIVWSDAADEIEDDIEDDDADWGAVEDADHSDFITEDDAAAAPVAEASTSRRSDLEATIAELEAAVSDADEFEPDGSEIAPEEIVWPARPSQRSDFVEDAELAAIPEGDTDFYPDPSPDEGIEDEGLPEDLKAPDKEATDKPDHSLADIDDDVDDLDELIASTVAGLDEETLRKMVAEIVREELMGTLGERITRNVRKLVRREIYRILSSQEFD